MIIIIIIIIIKKAKKKPHGNNSCFILPSSHYKLRQTNPVYTTISLSKFGTLKLFT